MTFYCLKNLEQSMTISTISVVIFLLMLGPILSMISYKLSLSHDNDLCEKYGITRPYKDDNVSQIMFSILAVVSCTLLIMAAINKRFSKTTILFFVVSVISIIFAIISGSSNEGSGGDENVDQHIKSWCGKKNNATKNINVVMAVLIGISLSILVSWSTSVISKTCRIQ